MENLKSLWQQKYNIVPQQLEKVADVKTVATAFNTNIDAVIKIKGSDIAQLAARVQITDDDLNSSLTKLQSAKDVVRGIIKCFSQGIGEEWMAEDKAIYEWMQENLGYDRLQMGGQGGIVANILAVSGVKNVIAHTSSHPQLQAGQFLPLPNLLSFDENANLRPAHLINRTEDVPLVHWIIEFDKNDSFTYLDKTYVCPKANRFIATYDPANLVLKTDENFANYLKNHDFDYLILSGYHNLTSERNGENLVKASVKTLLEWKKKSPNGIIHLELASTQDKKVRRAIIEEIAPHVDSIGLNDREALDVLEIIDEDKYKALKDKNLAAGELFDVLYRIQKALKAPRIQLHMFGLYITMQTPESKIAVEQNLRGMLLASTIAATKALKGKVDEHETLLAARNENIRLEALQNLAEHLQQPDLLTTGCCVYKDCRVIAVPTIIIDKPVTLVGMGDTISSMSLIGAR